MIDLEIVYQKSKSAYQRQKARKFSKKSPKRQKTAQFQQTKAQKPIMRNIENWTGKQENRKIKFQFSIQKNSCFPVSCPKSRFNNKS